MKNFLNLEKIAFLSLGVFMLLLVLEFANVSVEFIEYKIVFVLLNFVLMYFHLREKVKKLEQENATLKQKLKN